MVANAIRLFVIGVIHLVETENFPKKYYFLPTDTMLR